MSVDRMVRVNALLRRVVAEAMYRVMTEEGFDMASVTITGVETSTTLRSARVRVSIREHVADRNAMLRQIRKHASEIQDIVHKEVILKYTPKLDFVLDKSIERGDHVLEIIHKMEKEGLLEETPSPEPPPTAPSVDTRQEPSDI